MPFLIPTPHGRVLLNRDSYTPPITDVTNVFVAYSLRRVTSYTGPLIRIRRVSDSVELDFGSVADGSLDTTAISTFLLGTTGTISKWYDQGPNAFDVAQATAGSQPAYTENSYGSRPGLTFNGTSSNLTRASTTWNAADLMAFAVCKLTTAGGTYRALFTLASATTSGIELILSNGATSQDWVAADARADGNGSNSGRAPRAIPTTPGFADSVNHQHDLTLSAPAVDWVTDGSTKTLRASGVGQAQTVTGTMSVSLAAAAMAGTIAELIIFNIVYNNRTSLRSNQKSIWGTA